MFYIGLVHITWQENVFIRRDVHNIHLETLYGIENLVFTYLFLFSHTFCQLILHQLIVCLMFFFIRMNEFTQTKHINFNVARLISCVLIKYVGFCFCFIHFLKKLNYLHSLLFFLFHFVFVCSSWLTGFRPVFELLQKLFL